MLAHVKAILCKRVRLEMSTSEEEKKWADSLRAKVQTSRCRKMLLLHHSHFIFPSFFFFFLQQHLFCWNSFEQNDIYAAACDSGTGLDLDGGDGGRGRTS